MERNGQKSHYGELVEVMILSEPALRGSWRRGVVEKAGKNYSSVKYGRNSLKIKYRYGKVAMREGIKGFPSVEKWRRRSTIRPVPPLIENSGALWKYGYFVDVYRRGLWWEGVIVDHDEAASERAVFCPDEGDLEVCEVANIRVSQDWDIEENRWSIRGYWVLAALQESVLAYMGLDVVEAWHALKMRKDFKSRIGEWTVAKSELWHEVVMSYISERWHQSLMLVSFPIKDSLPLNALLKGDSIDYTTPQSNKVSYSKLAYDKTLQSKKSFYSKLGKRKGPLNMDEEVSGSKSKRRKLDAENLSSVMENVNMEDCPNVMTNYHTGRNHMVLAKWELLSLGWTLKLRRHKKTIVTHYVSPQGAKYRSLSDACRDVKGEWQDKDCKRGGAQENECCKWQSVQQNEKGKQKSQRSEEIQENEIQEQEEVALNELLGMLEYPSRPRRRLQRPLELENGEPSKGTSGKENENLIESVKKLNSGRKRRRRNGPRLQIQSSAPKTDQKRVKSVLSMLIKHRVLKQNEYIVYKTKNKCKKKGKATFQGIQCKCCKQYYSLAEFEAHAGGNVGEYGENIFSNHGKSLSQCFTKLWNKLKHKLKEERGGEPLETYHDDQCSICFDGGDLMLCDGCSTVVHWQCVNLKAVPEDKWFCQRCKCPLCGGTCFEDYHKYITDDTVLKCHQCELHYHEKCIRYIFLTGSRLCYDLEGNWFCSNDCLEVYLRLTSIIGQVNPINDTHSWTLLRSQEGENIQKYNAEQNNKLHVCHEIINECFEEMADERTKRDLTAELIFSMGSRYRGSDYKGYYTMILENRDDLISVVAIRIFGRKVAEMPLVATCFEHRRKGMCRLLLQNLEKLLESMGVRKLVLPAVSTLKETWEKGFGFTVMSVEEKEQLLDHYIVGFPDCNILQKKITDEVGVPMQMLTWKDNHNNAESDIK